MTTPSQLNANRLNAEKSTGPVTNSGKAASSHNRGSHFLSADATFHVLLDECEEDFHLSVCMLAADYQAEAGAERALVERMAEHEWMRRRALRFLDKMFNSHPEYQNPFIRDDSAHFNLMMRYQTMHERAFL